MRTFGIGAGQRWRLVMRIDKLIGKLFTFRRWTRLRILDPLYWFNHVLFRGANKLMLKRRRK